MAIALSGSLILSGSIIVSGSITSTGTVIMSGSIASASYALNATTGAYANTSTSASYALNATTFNGLASSIFATTGSNTFIGNQVVSGSLTTSGSITATGTITAQTLVIQTITSSTVYSSGSNIFGNAIGNTQTFTGSVLITGSLTIAGGSSATSYSGATIYGSTAVCSPVGKFTSCIDAGVGTFSSSVTAASFEVGNGQYYAARRSSGNLLINLLGIESGTDNTRLVSTGDFNIVNGGLSSQFKIASTGVATFACSVTSNYLSSVISSSSNASPLILQNTAGWASSQISSITVKDASDAVGAIGWKYDGAGNVDMLFHSLYNGAYKTTSDVVMTVKGTGNVGIGTVSPTQQLSLGMSAISTTRTYVVDNQGTLSFYNLTTGNLEAYLDIASVRSGNDSTLGGSNIRFLTQSTSSTISGCERMRISSTGYVGINVTSACKHLEVGGTIRTTVSPSVYYRDMSYIGDNYQFGPGETTDNVDFKICGGSTWSAGGNFRWWTQAGNTTPTERMRITSGGNVLIGNPATNSTIRLHVKGAQNADWMAAFDNTGTNPYGLRIDTTANAGSAYSLAVYTNSATGFFVKNDGTVSIGTTTNNYIVDMVTGANNSLLYLNQSNGAVGGNAALIANINTTGGYLVLWRYGGSTKGSITTDGTGVAYNTTSDYRLKEDFQNFNAIEKINTINVYDFKWKEISQRGYGVIAHELAEVLPQYVNGKKDGLDKEGNIQPQSVDYSKLVPVLVKGMQEQQCTICSQASMINTLKTCLGII